MRRLKIIVSLIICLVFKSLALLYSQDTVTKGYSSEEFKVYFQFDKYNFNPAFRENEEVVNALFSEVDRVGTSFIDSIVIVSHSSPEGVYEHNVWLSDRRAFSMKNYIARHRSDVAALLQTRSEGEAWDDLRELIAGDTIIDAKLVQKALDIIDAEINVGTKKWRMEQHPSYRYFLGTHYRELRNSAIFVIYYKPEISCQDIEVEYDKLLAEEMEPLVIEQYRVEQMDFTPEKREIFFARTNLLVPLLNVGAEVPIGNNWSVGADYYFPWMFRDGHHKNCFQVLAWSVEGRYWFGKNRQEEDLLEGHSVGLSTMIGYYDIQRNYVGHQGTLYNISVDYLYSLPIFKDRMHLEFSLGLGYFISPKAQPYEVKEDGGLAYKKGYTKDFQWLGPNKAGVSLVVPIKAKRGGKR